MDWLLVILTHPTSCEDSRVSLQDKDNIFDDGGLPQLFWGLPQYKSPSLPKGDMFQAPQWMPEIVKNTNEMIFLYTHPWYLSDLQIKHTGHDQYLKWHGTIITIYYTTNYMPAGSLSRYLLQYLPHEMMCGDTSLRDERKGAEGQGPCELACCYRS